MSLYSMPCLQEVDGITVLWGVRGAVGLFPCEGMTITVCAAVLPSKSLCLDNLSLIHTCKFLGVNYCVNFSVHTITKNGYITHY